MFIFLGLFSLVSSEPSIVLISPPVTCDVCQHVLNITVNLKPDPYGLDVPPFHEQFVNCQFWQGSTSTNVTGWAFSIPDKSLFARATCRVPPSLQIGNVFVLVDFGSFYGSTPFDRVTNTSVWKFTIVQSPLLRTNSERLNLFYLKYTSYHLVSDIIVRQILPQDLRISEVRPLGLHSRRQKKTAQNISCCNQD